MNFNLIYNPDVIGSFAGVLTTIAFIPQLIKTWRSKSANDVSFGMFMLFSIGVLLWGIYGWEIHALPVLLTNIVTLILASSILVLKIIFSFNSEIN